MEEKIKICYRSVIKHEDHQVSDHYEGEAIHQWQLGRENFRFTHQQYGMMEIEINGNQLILKREQAKMVMQLYEKKAIHYQVPYGVIEMQALLKKLEKKHDKWQIIYDLYDGNQILSKCYLTIALSR